MSKTKLFDATDESDVIMEPSNVLRYGRKMLLSFKLVE